MESGSEQEKEKDAARCLHKGAVSNGVDCVRALHTEDLVIVPTLFAIHPPPSLPAPPRPAPFPRFSLHSRIAKTREQNSWKKNAQGGDGVQSVSILRTTP